MLLIIIIIITKSQKGVISISHISAYWTPSSSSRIPCSYSSYRMIHHQLCTVRDLTSFSVAQGFWRGSLSLNHHWLWSLASNESLISTLCLLLICLFSIPGYTLGYSSMVQKYPRYKLFMEHSFTEGLNDGEN